MCNFRFPRHWAQFEIFYCSCNDLMALPRATYISLLSFVGLRPFAPCRIKVRRALFYRIIVEYTLLGWNCFYNRLWKLSHNVKTAFFLEKRKIFLKLIFNTSIVYFCGGWRLDDGRWGVKMQPMIGKYEYFIEWELFFILYAASSTFLPIYVAKL